MTPSKFIFQSSSWEELFHSTNNTETHTSIKNEGSHQTKQLVNVLTQRVRSIRRYRLNSASKNKRSVEKCCASDLLSHTASTLIGKVLTASLNSSKTSLSQHAAIKPSSNKSKSRTFVDDDMSDISVSSVEDESTEPFSNSSLEYVWILGMQFVVFDSSFNNVY
jgi:hypothetical protein